jgi:hypothetical protein
MAVIALVEFHDGKVESVVMEKGGRIVIHFSHMSVYEERAQHVYDIVSYEAELAATEVVELNCRGALNHGDKVAFVRVNDQEPTSSSLDETETMLNSGRVAELHFDSGTIIAFRCSRMGIKLGRRGTVVEEWAGPL